jgi:hypothetical protein
MKVSDYKSVYESASGKLSDINRNIALAGIALVWIFTKTDTQTIIPKELIFPAFLLVISLTCDILQYAYSTIIWAIVFRRKELKISKENLPLDTEFTHSTYLSLATWIFFGVKIILVFLAYCLIINFLICKIM